MTGHCATAVEKYLQLTGQTLNDLSPVATPCLDDQMLSDEDFQTVGTVSPVAARVVLTVLYLTRHNRPDVYWSVNNMARNLKGWRRAEDKRLKRLICWLHFTDDVIQFAYCGDHIEDCFVVQFVDAGFAGDLMDSKSTGGAICFLIGPRTCVPISWMCKKIGAVCHSSTEAEVVSLDTALRMEGIPHLHLWEE